MKKNVILLAIGVLIVVVGVFLLLHFIVGLRFSTSDIIIEKGEYPSQEFQPVFLGEEQYDQAIRAFGELRPGYEIIKKNTSMYQAISLILYERKCLDESEAKVIYKTRTIFQTYVDGGDVEIHYCEDIDKTVKRLICGECPPTTIYIYEGNVLK